MRDTRQHLVAIALGLVGASGCGAPPEEEAIEPGPPPTWEEFRSIHVLESRSTGTRVIEGDIRVLSEEAIREYYDAHYRPAAPGGDVENVQQELKIYLTENGKVNKWSKTMARRLTYCVSKKGFKEHYGAMVRAIERATEEWEDAANVNFIHKQSKDDNCTFKTDVVFNIIPTPPDAEYEGAAPTPDFPREYRQLELTPTPGGTTRLGLARHELGHVLGFAHEHVFTKECPEEDPVKSLTTYDRKSTMHYRDCLKDPRTGNRFDMPLTSRDKQGARKVYPF